MRVLLAMGLLLLGTASGIASDKILALQHLLNTAGFSAGSETGEWSKANGEALARFETRYGLAPAAVGNGPDDAVIGPVLDGAKAAVEAEYQAFPTGKLPDPYFVATGSQNEVNPSTWAQRATVLVDGKMARVPVSRYYQILDSDIAQFKAAGIGVFRVQINVDATLFWKECQYEVPVAYEPANICYDKAYAAAQKNGWTAQREAMDHIADNPFVKLAMEDIAQFTASGLHVIVVPSDFYWGEGSDSRNNAHPPLLHHYLESDPQFRELYAVLAAALTRELKRRDITNFSFQSLNEPEFCGDGATPTKKTLAKWQGFERTVLDAVRQVAPKLSLVATAACTAGDQFFAQGGDYSEVGRVMPLYPELDDVTYAIHFRNPRILVQGGTTYALKPGVEVPYPYKALAKSAGLDFRAKFEIGLYNALKPGPQFYDQAFGKLEAFAKEKGIRLLITEFDVMKPSMGISREDRLALVKDIVAATKKHGVSLTYFSTVGREGMSSCPHDFSVPDHRFDPALLNLLAWGNGVAGATPDAAVEPLEVQCGRPVTIHTVESQSIGAPNSVAIDSILTTTTKGVEVVYNLKGFYYLDSKELAQLTVTLTSPSVGPKPNDKLKKCFGVELVAFGGEYHVRFKLDGPKGKLRARHLKCVLDNAPKQVVTALHVITDDMRELAEDLVASGEDAGISNDNLRAWFNDIAAGNIVVGPISD